MKVSDAVRRLSPKKRMIIGAILSRALIEDGQETPMDYRWLFMFASWLQVVGIDLNTIKSHEDKARVA